MCYVFDCQEKEVANIELFILMEKYFASFFSKKYFDNKHKHKLNRNNLPMQPTDSIKSIFPNIHVFIQLNKKKFAPNGKKSYICKH